MCLQRSLQKGRQRLLGANRAGSPQVGQATVGGVDAVGLGAAGVVMGQEHVLSAQRELKIGIDRAGLPVVMAVLQLHLLQPHRNDQAVATDLWDQAQRRLAELNALSEGPDFWNDAETAQKLMRERTSLEDQINGITKLERDLDDALTLIELGEMEEDEATVSEGEAAIKAGLHSVEIVDGEPKSS